ncbi:membrane protein [Flavobacterium sp. MEB061]|uniref:BamA/TamA family outer membrane protein n=1 Tax=Flavobacterium sp. MEB061 TaxID=1587524 RepID=UPI0005ABE222|nr:BamA/TamA family outer membrane protein [Flavobacterium sp. MEB061]KIQ14447.1 membrane protein [Flavobacterium sp. MEB061]
MQRISFTLLFFLFCLLASAQNKQIDSATTPAPAKNIDFNVMPYINYNRTLDFMFGAIPMMMYKIDKTDTISPKSLSGLSGVYTTNKSYFISLFNKFYFKEDKWRAQLFFVTGDHNSQFYMDDLEAPDFYDYGTKTTIVNTSLQRKIIKSLYLGIGYSYAHYNTKYEDDVQPASITHTNGLQLITLYDTRNAVYYPTKGDKIRLRWITYPEWFGNDVNANKILTEYNKYFPMRSGTDVLAARFSGKFGLGNIAFEQQVTIGGEDIRGYSEGKYRGDGLIALQSEYRYNFNKKMGLVGFAGIATIYGSDTADFNWNIYPGAGVGYRYRAFKTEKFNVGLDAAVGKGDWGIYFRIGEAF